MNGGVYHLNDGDNCDDGKKITQQSLKTKKKVNCVVINDSRV